MKSASALISVRSAYERMVEDPLSSIATADIAPGTPVLITGIQSASGMRAVQLKGLYVGELDLPIEMIDPETYNLLSSLRIPIDITRMRTEKIYVRAWKRTIRGDECRWEVITRDFLYRYSS